MIYQCSYCKTGAMITAEQYSLHINGTKHKKKAFQLQAPFAGIEYEEFRPKTKLKPQIFQPTNDDFPSLSPNPRAAIITPAIQYGNIKGNLIKPINLEKLTDESTDTANGNSTLDDDENKETKTINDIFFKSNSKSDSARHILSTYSKNNKTASAALNEVAVAMNWDIDFEQIKAASKAFAFKVRICGFDSVSGEGDTKKDARQHASYEAIKYIRTEMRKGKNEDGKSDVIPANVSFRQKESYEWPPDAYCRLTMNKLLEIECLRENKFVVPRRYVAFIMTDHKDQLAKDGVVVAFGAGNGVLKRSDSLAKFPGYHVTNFDSLVLARRSLQCFLYNQLSLIFDRKLRECSSEKAYFTIGKNGKVKLKECCRIHLFMSHAPHGDCVQSFPLNWTDPIELPAKEMERDKSGKVVPTMSMTYGGCQNLRQPGHIMVAPDGCKSVRWVSLVDYRAKNKVNPDYMVMSPSDKLMSWVHLGLQGAMLSHLLDPVPIYSIQVANDYEHGHFARALLCRVPLQSLDQVNGEMPPKKDPFIGRVSKIPEAILPLLGLCDGSVAYNWYSNRLSDLPEMINTDTGLVHEDSPFKLSDGDPDYLCSRLSKVCMLLRLKSALKLATDYYGLKSEQKRTRMLRGVANAAGGCYNLFKEFSVDYRSLKRSLFLLLSEKYLGMWAPNNSTNNFDLEQLYVF